MPPPSGIKSNYTKPVDVFMTPHTSSCCSLLKPPPSLRLLLLWLVDVKCTRVGRSTQTPDFKSSVILWNTKIYLARISFICIVWNHLARSWTNDGLKLCKQDSKCQNDKESHHVAKQAKSQRHKPDKTASGKWIQLTQTSCVGLLRTFYSMILKWTIQTIDFYYCSILPH